MLLWSILVRGQLAGLMGGWWVRFPGTKNPHPATSMGWGKFEIESSP